MSTGLVFGTRQIQHRKHPSPILDHTIPYLLDQFIVPERSVTVLLTASPGERPPKTHSPLSGIHIDGTARFPRRSGFVCR